MLRVLEAKCVIILETSGLLMETLIYLLDHLKFTITLSLSYTKLSSEILNTVLSEDPLLASSKANM